MDARLLHVNVNCADLERSVAFYAELGFSVVRDFGTMDSPGMGRAFRLPAGRIRVVHLAIGDAPGAMWIDLVQWLDPRPLAVEPRPLNGLGIGRLCLAVPDVGAATERLRHAGVTFWTEAESLGEGTGIRTVCFNDPDGTVLQLIQGV